MCRPAFNAPHQKHAPVSAYTHVCNSIYVRASDEACAPACNLWFFIMKVGVKNRLNTLHMYMCEYTYIYCPWVRLYVRTWFRRGTRKHHTLNPTRTSTADSVYLRLARTQRIHPAIQKQLHTHTPHVHAHKRTHTHRCWEIADEGTTNKGLHTESYTQHTHTQYNFAHPGQVSGISPAWANIQAQTRYIRFVTSIICSMHGSVRALISMYNEGYIEVCARI